MTEPTPEEQPAKQPAAAINLDELEADGTRGDFIFIHNGQTWTLKDPQEIDWQDLMAALGNPVMFFRAVMPPEQQNQFLALKMPTRKVNALVQRYLQHYGMPDLGGAVALPRQ